MKYTEDGDRVTLEMDREDYNMLLLMLGYATGAASKEHNQAKFWRLIDFVNRLNADNPNFRPYEIPEEYAKPKTVQR
jgi:hypothetical protein